MSGQLAGKNLCESLSVLDTADAVFATAHAEASTSFSSIPSLLGGSRHVGEAVNTYPFWSSTSPACGKSSSVSTFIMVDEDVRICSLESSTKLFGAGPRLWRGTRGRLVVTRQASTGSRLIRSVYGGFSGRNEV
jgi:hypothetical protein